MSSRREDFVDLALRYAEDDGHGYSQKPPSGRWGPDYDCSSLLYKLANEAGYPVGTGGDKVRFTGTMLKDFEKAGFQILPFANVGISDLEVGDILAAVQGNALQEMQNNNQNTQYLMGAFNDKYNELQRDIAGVAMTQQAAIANQNECCCSTKMLISDLASQQRYDSAMQNNAILQAIAGIGSKMDQNEITNLRDKVNGLELQNAMNGVVRYPMSTAYNAGYNPFCNCGNMGMCA